MHKESAAKYLVNTNNILISEDACKKRFVKIHYTE